MLQREEQGVNARSLTHQIIDSIFNNGPEMSQDAPDLSQWPNTETDRDEESGAQSRMARPGRECDKSQEASRVTMTAKYLI
jgi:hypothetical protein